MFVRLFAELVSSEVIPWATAAASCAWAARLWSSAARSCGLCDMILLRVTVRLSHVSSLRLTHFPTL